MLTPHANFIAAIQESELRIAEIYDFTLISGQVFRYTTHAQDLMWNAANDIYKSITLTRGGINKNINLEVDMIELYLGNISGDFFDILQNNTLNNIKVMIRRIIWDSSYAADMEITPFIGIGDINFDRKELVMSCKSILDSLNIQVPRDEWQEPCNKRLYDPGCALIQADFEYQGVVAVGNKISFTDAIRGSVFKGIFDAATTILSIGDIITGDINGYTAMIVQVVYESATVGTIWYVELSNSANFEDDEVLDSSGNDITLNGVPIVDASFYPLGEVVVLSGNNIGERRQIGRDIEDEITVRNPFPNDFESGDTYSIYPGCDKTTDHCGTAKFNNVPKFRGFIYIPRIEETIT